MLPHPDTIISLNTLQHQARLREAARDRIAACGEVDRRLRPARSRSARLAAASWLNDVATCVRAAIRGCKPFLRTSDSARNAHPVA